MKNILMTFAALLTSSFVWAGTVTEQQALQKARQFMTGKTLEESKTITRKNVRKAQGSATTAAYYIFNATNNGGFVIVSGDDRTQPILGYADKGMIDAGNMPENMQAWLDGYAGQIEALGDDGQESGGLQSLRTSPNRTAVAPLITARWSQGAPYNLQCPELEGNRSVTGCVATAMAQVMYYHKWPQGATAEIPSYTFSWFENSTSSWQDKTLDALPATTFQWNKMTDTYSSNDTGDAADAVAKLMRYCGQAVCMQYSPYGSGANVYANTMTSYFGYSNTARDVVRQDYTSETWEQLIYDELAANRPVLYAGASGSGGHQFVCDGYDGNGLFHINWGWGGMSDGYFVLSLLNPDDQGIGGSTSANGYTIGQEAIIGLQPGTASVGGSTCSVYVNNCYFPYVSYTRTSTSDNFVNIRLQDYIYSADIDGTIDHAYILEKDGLQISILNENSNVNLKRGNFRQMDASVSFGAGLADGNYVIRDVYRPTGTSEWVPCRNTGRNFIIANIGGKVLTLKLSENIDDDFVVHSVTFDGRFVEGSPLTAKLNVTNNGYANNKTLYLRQGTTESTSGIVDAWIDPGQTKDVTINFNVRNTGEVPVKITTSNNSNVLWSGTVNIAEGLEQNLSITVAVEGERNNAIEGNAINATYTFTNTGDNDYDDNVVFYLYPRNENESVISSETRVSSQHLTLAKGETTSLQIQYADLAPGSYSMECCYYSKTVRKWSPYKTYRVGYPMVPVKLTATVSAENADENNRIYDTTIKANIVLTNTGDNPYNERIQVKWYYLKDNGAWSSQNPEYYTMQIGVGQTKTLHLEKDGLTKGNKYKIYAYYYSENLSYNLVTSDAYTLAEEDVEWYDGDIFTAKTTEGIDMTFKVLSVADKTCIVGSEESYSKPSIDKTTEGSVTIPASVNGFRVVGVGKYAFYNCYKLTEVVLPDDVLFLKYDAFYGCSQLTKINMPNSLETIASYAFNYCSALQSLVIPETVSSIEEGAFRGCSGLKSLQVASGNTYYDSRNGCNAIINTSTNALVAGCKNTVIPNTVTSILSNAFYGSQFASIDIPNFVTSIGDYAFSHCRLTAITLPESLITMGSYAFEYTHLRSVLIPASVSSIGTNPFSSCRYLTSIVVSPENTTFDSRDNCNAIIRSASNELVSGCSNTIPNTVTAIGNYAFSYCDSLASVEIPPSVVSIGSHAFYSCTSMTSVEIPASVTSIGSYAFGYCNKLNSVSAGWATPLTINADVFYKVTISEVTLYVPVGSKSLYEQSNVWKDFKEVVEVESQQPTNIEFADAEVKRICVENWDTNGDGELSYDEAAAVTNLGEAFSNNQNITSFDELQFFTGITAINKDAFYYCSSLQTICFPEQITAIEETSFWQCNNLQSLFIPYNVNNISSTAFIFCGSLQSIIVSSDNPKYDSRNGCNAVVETATNTLILGCKNTVIPNNVLAIGDHAFDRNDGIESMIIPDCVVSIGGFNFYACKNLKEIRIPKSVTSINFSFLACSSALTIKVDKDNPKYDSRNDCNAIIETATNKLIIGCQTTIIPSSVVDIGLYAFSSQVHLSEMVIPKGVRRISHEAFAYCYGLSLISLPKTLEEIGDYAFWGCNDLLTIYSYNPQPPVLLGDNIFVKNIYNQSDSIIHHATLYVPKGSKGAYQNADQWKRFTHIVEMEDDGASGIDFADAEVKRICVENWDTNGDGELSYDEAAAVTTLNKVFRSTSISSFDEFRHFVGVKSLKFEEFYNCTNMTSISLPNSLTYSDQNSFCGCTKLVSINWPVNDEFLFSTGVFQGCTFTTVTIPYNMVISGGTFSRCHKLTEILVDSANPYYQSVDGVVYSKDMKSILAYPNGKETTEYTIIDGVEEIGANAFATSIKLSKLNIPNSVKTLGYYCFGEMSISSLSIPSGVTAIPSYCCAWNRNLVEVNIPDGVTKIGNYAFAGVNCKVITIPANVSEIGYSAFYGIENLEKVISLISDPFPIDWDVFWVNSDGDFTTATLYVPKGCVEKYRDTQVWQDFQTILEIGDDVEMGDVSGDGEIDLSDAIMVIYYTLHLEPSGFNMAAADVNGDGEVDLSDAITIIYKSLGVLPSRSMVQETVADTSNDYMQMKTDGNNYAVSLTNEGEYVGMQCDITLPEGMTLEDISLSESRASKHTVLWNQMGDGRFRVMVFSMKGAAFFGQMGELFKFEVNGNRAGQVKMENIFLVDADLQKHPFADLTVQTTGIDDPLTKSEELNSEMYDLQGRKVAKPQKGIYLKGNKKVITK